MEIEITFIGKYGERFTYFEKENGGHIVSCKEIEMKDKLMSEEEFNNLFKTYREIGVSNFDKNNKEKLYSRALNLGEELKDNFYFFRRNNGTYQKLTFAARICEILKDVEALKLTEDEYVNHFIKCNEKVSEEYAQFMLKFGKEIVNKEER